MPHFSANSPPDAFRPPDCLTPQAYRRRQQWLAGLLVVQLVGGLAVLLAPGQEVFPLYSWFLFPLTPNAEVRFRVRILADQSPNHTTGQFLPVGPAVVALGRDLGRALDAGDTKEAHRVRGLLEAALPPGTQRYELEAVRFEPIARLRSGQEEVIKVDVFTPGEP